MTKHTSKNHNNLFQTGSGKAVPDKKPEEIPKFAVVADSWLQEVKENKKLSTYVKYNNIYESYIKETFKDAPITSITNIFVLKNLPQVSSESITKSVCSVINQIMKYASKQYLLPLPNISKITPHIKTKPVEVLTKTEQKKLFSVLCEDIDTSKAAVLLCLYTGLRLGEVCALKWSDIDFENKIITINKTVQRLYVEGHDTKTILLETMPKSECSRREIPMSKPIMNLMRIYKTDSVYVFGKDKAMEPRTMQYNFKKILQEAGIQNKNFHILRHTFATNCIESGTDVKSLSEILGHSDVEITLNRYVHPSMDLKRKYMDGLSEFYGL